MGRETTLLLFLIILGLSQVAGQGVHIVYQVLQGWLGDKAEFTIKSRLVGRLLRLQTPYFDQKQGGTVHKVLEDGTRIKEAGEALAFDFFRNGLSLLVFLPLMLWVSWPLGLIKLLVTPLPLLVSQFFAPHDRKLEQELWSQGTQWSTQIQETWSGIKLYKAFGQETTRESALKGSLLQLRKGVGLRRVWSALWQGFGTIVDTLGTVTLLGLGLYALMEGNLTFGQWMAFGLLSQQASSSLLGLFETNRKLFLASNALGRLVEFQDQPLEVLGPKAPLEGRLRVTGLGFAYSGSKRVLHDLNFEIAPGEKVALVGPSGCGKSTLLQLLMGYHSPLEGKIRFQDSILGPGSLGGIRSSLGLVLQETPLFSATLKQNLTMGDPSIKLQCIWKALEEAGALDFVLELPQRLDTPCGSGALQFSGGQKQRLGLARALIPQPSLLLLDEVTSALDTQAEAQILHTLEALGNNRSLLFVTHRLRGLKNFDRILVLDRGRLVEEGTHSHLLALGGVYTSLWEALP